MMANGITKTYLYGVSYLRSRAYPNGGRNNNHNQRIRNMLTRIAIYRDSGLVTVIEGLPHIAWREAVAEVRRLDAFGNKHGSRGQWYRTANRDGYMCGSYRATQVIAPRRNDSKSARIYT